MQQKVLYVLLLGSVFLAGRAGNQRAAAPEKPGTVDVPVSQTVVPTATPTTSANAASSTDWVPPLFISPEEETS